MLSINIWSSNMLKPFILLLTKLPMSFNCSRAVSIIFGKTRSYHKIWCIKENKNSRVMSLIVGIVSTITVLTVNESELNSIVPLHMLARSFSYLMPFEFWTYLIWHHDGWPKRELYPQWVTFWKCHSLWV